MLKTYLQLCIIYNRKKKFSPEQIFETTYGGRHLRLSEKDYSIVLLPGKRSIFCPFAHVFVGIILSIKESTRGKHCDYQNMTIKHCDYQNISIEEHSQFW